LPSLLRITYAVARTAYAEGYHLPGPAALVDKETPMDHVPSPTPTDPGFLRLVHGGGSRNPGPASVSAAVRLELERHDWAALGCGCGRSADHIPAMFEAVLTAQTPEDFAGSTFFNHLEICADVVECSVPAVGVILAALAGELSAPARRLLLETLYTVVAGGTHDTELQMGNWGLAEQCRSRALEGLWTVLQAGLTGSPPDAEIAADICELVDTDEARSVFYQARLRERTTARMLMWQAVG
jgi:hypothetical protein